MTASDWMSPHKAQPVVPRKVDRNRPAGKEFRWTTQLSSFAIIACLLGLPLPFLVVPLMEVLKSAGVLR